MMMHVSQLKELDSSIFRGRHLDRGQQHCQDREQELVTGQRENHADTVCFADLSAGIHRQV